MPKLKDTKSAVRGSKIYCTHKGHYYNHAQPNVSYHNIFYFASDCVITVRNNCTNVDQEKFEIHSSHIWETLGPLDHNLTIIEIFN